MDMILNRSEPGGGKYQAMTPKSKTPRLGNWRDVTIFRKA
tara:strand:- start:1051 stop:1170 length:120 start_codon:yes stop_codon:yes gene_type:complete